MLTKKSRRVVFLKHIKKLAVLLTVVLVCLANTIPPLTHLAFASTDDNALSTQLKSVLNLDYSPGYLSNVPEENKAEAENLLQMFQQGSNMFSGSTPAEQQLKIITTLIGYEINHSGGAAFVNEVANDSVDALDEISNNMAGEAGKSDVSDIQLVGNTITNLAYVGGLIKAIQNQQEEEVIYGYVSDRDATQVTDESEWERITGIYTSQIYKDAGRDIFLQTDENTLHQDSLTAYSSYEFFKEFSASPKAKQDFKDKVIADLSVQSPPKQGWLSSILTGTEFILTSIASGIKNIVVETAGLVGNLAKQAAGGLTNLVTGNHPPATAVNTGANISSAVNQLMQSKPITNTTQPSAEPLAQPTNQRIISLKIELACDLTQNFSAKPIPFVDLSWNPGSNDFSTATLYRDGRVIDTYKSNGGDSYGDGTVKPGLTYQYSIIGQYPDGYSASASTTITVPIGICPASINHCSSLPETTGYTATAAVVDNSSRPISGLRYELISPPKALGSTVNYGTNISGTSDAGGHIFSKRIK